MFKRVLGRTGVELSVVGFGGIICMNASAEECSRNVGKAIERGINYFDVAPSYGNAEEMLGPALEPYRKNIFLACKTGKRTKDEAWAELKASLQHLRTDYFDVYQLHGVTTLEEVDTINRVQPYFIPYTKWAFDLKNPLMVEETNALTMLYTLLRTTLS